jgi:hypothetical protein
MLYFRSLIVFLSFIFVPGVRSFGWSRRKTKQVTKPSLVYRGGAVDNEPQTVLYHKLSDTVLFKGKWRSLWNRRVRFPSGANADFEIVTQNGTDQAVLIFVWNSATKTTTLVREFMPASDGMKIGLAAGMVDDKHSNDDEDPILVAAQFELEEECRLKGGKWQSLVANILMDKYSTTRLSVYLVIDPTPVECANARSRDELEEGMQILSNVPISQLLTWIDGGHMTVVGSWACLLALRKLKELGEID